MRLYLPKNVSCSSGCNKKAAQGPLRSREPTFIASTPLLVAAESQGLLSKISGAPVDTPDAPISSPPPPSDRIASQSGSEESDSDVAGLVDSTRRAVQHGNNAAAKEGLDVPTVAEQTAVRRPVVLDTCLLERSTRARTYPMTYRPDEHLERAR